MKKSTIVLCAALIAAGGSWAQAGIVYTPKDLGQADYLVGLYNPNDPGTINSVFVTSASGGGAFVSDYFTFTFAVHGGTGIGLRPYAMVFSFGYDNDSIEVIGARPTGDFSTWWNNYSTGASSPIAWPNPSSGWVLVPSLWQSGSPITGIYGTSAVIPFFQVTLHVKDAITSHINGFAITALTLYDTEFTLYPNDFVYFGGAIHEVPEPASMTLLFGGLAGIAGRVVRRRRRAA